MHNNPNAANTTKWHQQLQATSKRRTRIKNHKRHKKCSKMTWVLKCKTTANNKKQQCEQNTEGFNWKEFKTQMQIRIKNSPKFSLRAINTRLQCDFGALSFLLPPFLLHNLFPLNFSPESPIFFNQSRLCRTNRSSYFWVESLQTLTSITKILTHHTSLCFQFCKSPASPYRETAQQ